MVDLNISNFTLRYLTRRGMIPIVTERINSQGGKFNYYIKEKTFFLMAIFCWENTPEGYDFWKNLNKEIREKYFEIIQNAYIRSKMAN